MGQAVFDEPVDTGGDHGDADVRLPGVGIFRRTEPALPVAIGVNFPVSDKKPAKKRCLSLTLPETVIFYNSVAR